MQAQAPKALLLIGASEGAYVVAKIAVTDARVTHLALIGAGGASMREHLRLLAQRIWYLRAAQQKFAAIAADPESTVKTAWGHSHRYWSSLLDVDMGELLPGLDIPIVLAMGARDESVPIETAFALQQKFAQRGKTNFHLHAFPDADHRLYDRARDRSYSVEFLQALLALMRAGGAQ